MRQGKARANGLELAYEDFGEEGAPAILLIMGLGAQLVLWPDKFVDDLVERGYRVIRYDNRDIGLSTKLEGAKTPGIPRMLLGSLFGLPVGAPYTLDDMAADAVGLLDALGIARAHIVGASMGGMIAQLVAAHYSDRVLSLTSIMSTSGRRGLPGPHKDLRKRFLEKRPVYATREEALADGLRVFKLIGTQDNGASDDERRRIVAKSVDRGLYPEGFSRQLAAIVASGSRASLLPRITAKTLVIHGRDDRLVPLKGGEDVARRIPGARLEVIDDMAHDLPPVHQAHLAALIAQHARSATQA